MNSLRKRFMSDEWIADRPRLAALLMMLCGVFGSGAIGIASVTAARIPQLWIALPLVGFMGLGLAGWLGYVFFTLRWVNSVIKRAERDHRNQGDLIATLHKLRVGELAYWTFIVAELPAGHPAREAFERSLGLFYDGVSGAELVNLHLAAMREHRGEQEAKKAQE